MKKTYNNRMNQVLLLVSLFLALAALEGCAKKIYFATSTVVPAAVGKVKVKKDNNNNYTVEVNVTHLASPDKLNPPRDVYVVWIETENHGVRNIGRINSSGSFLSSTLKASLKTVTSFKPTKVFITAEEEGDIRRHGMLVVLTTDDF